MLCLQQSQYCEGCFQGSSRSLLLPGKYVQKSNPYRLFPETEPQVLYDLIEEGPSPGDSDPPVPELLVSLVAAELLWEDNHHHLAIAARPYR